ncbi:hypothetical protein QFC24_006251 [Naganishia onofrii]|uniref:Uncharacterized protein n=1 Tax=Naganishia onofrii TaxID=1851511 RepID=A0ACC2X5U6_9TREE|nr:hypothetical protein QFC24_006251 [Naganishia onofrii]
MKSASLSTVDIQPLAERELIPPRFVYLDIKAGRWYPLAALPVIVRFQVRFTNNIKSPEVWSRLTSADFANLPVPVPDSRYRHEVIAAFVHARSAPHTTTSIAVENVTGGNAKRKLQDRFKFARVSATAMLDYVPDESEEMYHAIKGNEEHRSDSVLSASNYHSTMENPVLLDAEAISTADLTAIGNFVLGNDTAKRPTVFPMDLWMTSYYMWNPLAQNWNQVGHPGFYGFWDYTQEVYRLCTSVRSIRDPPLNTWWANRLCGMQTAARNGFSFFAKSCAKYDTGKRDGSKMPFISPSANESPSQPRSYLETAKKQSQGRQGRDARLAEQSLDLSQGPTAEIETPRDPTRAARQHVEPRQGDGSVQERDHGRSEAIQKKRKASSWVGYKGKGKERVLLDDEFINDGDIDYEHDDEGEDDMY